MLKLINNIFTPTTRFFSNNPIYAIKASVVHPVSAFITSIYDIFLCDCLVSASLSRTHTNTHAALTVSDGLHAEAQQCMQEVDYVIEGVSVDVLAHSQAKLKLVQLIQVGEAVLGLKERFLKINFKSKVSGCWTFFFFLNKSASNKVAFL